MVGSVKFISSTQWGIRWSAYTKQDRVGFTLSGLPQPAIHSWYLLCCRAEVRPIV
jgi:hypothetical protein